MRSRLIPVAVALLMLLLVSQAYAGLRISLKDGTSVRGEMVRRTSNEIVIRTGGVLRTIEVKNVKNIDYEHLSSDSFNSLFGTSPNTELDEDSTRLLLQSRGYLPSSATGEVSRPSGADPKASIVRPEDFTAELKKLSRRPKGYYSFYEGHDKEQPSKTVEQLEPMQLVYLTSGKVLKGWILRETNKNLVLQLKNGTISIPKSTVKIIETETLQAEPEAKEVSDATQAE